MKTLELLILASCLHLPTSAGLVHFVVIGTAKSSKLYLQLLENSLLVACIMG